MKNNNQNGNIMQMETHVQSQWEISLNMFVVIGSHIVIFMIAPLMWYSHMMTSSNGNICRVTGPLCGEFTGPGEFPTQRPVTRSFDVYFDLRLNKRLSKQPWGWWFETLLCPLWRHSNDKVFD